MPQNQKTVNCKITFDSDGNVVGVEGDGKSAEKKILKDNPIHGVVGTAMVVVTADDDPCVVQGTYKYCW